MILVAGPGLVNDHLYLSIVQVEPGTRLGCGGVRVDSKYERLFAGLNNNDNPGWDQLVYLQIRAADVVCPSTPKAMPQT